MAVGSGPAHHTEAELFDFETDNWTVVSCYPFSGKHLDSFAMLYIRDLSAYFVIGGNGNNKKGLRTIAEFKNGVWSEAGQLLTTHNVSFNSFFCLKTDSRDLMLNGQMET